MEGVEVGDAMCGILEKEFCDLLLPMGVGLMKFDGLVPVVRRAWGLRGALGRGGKGDGTALEELLLGGRDLC